MKFVFFDDLEEFDVGVCGDHRGLRYAIVDVIPIWIRPTSKQVDSEQMRPKRKRFDQLELLMANQHDPLEATGIKGDLRSSPGRYLFVPPTAFKGCSEKAWTPLSTVFSPT